MKTISTLFFELQQNNANARFKFINILAIVVGIVFCLLVNFIPNFNELYAYPLTFVVVISLGLIHGSLDYDIEASHQPATNRFLFSVKYILQMTIVATIWMAAPSIAFGLFILFTAWHFGETDFSLFKVKFEPVIVLIYGMGITGWILGNHIPERAEFIASLPYFSSNPANLAGSLKMYTILVSLVSLALILVAVIASKMYLKPTAILALATLLTFTWYLPLLIAFTFYFGFWHSMHTINLIMNDIKINAKALVIKSIPYLGTSVLIGIASVVLLGALKFNTVLALFIFISALTLPHASIMHKMLKRYRSAVHLQWF
jgi:Brp/Blh family beta-carotene 15,15'-monooxygenase